MCLRVELRVVFGGRQYGHYRKGGGRRRTGRRGRWRRDDGTRDEGETRRERRGGLRAGEDRRRLILFNGNSRGQKGREGGGKGSAGRKFKPDSLT